MSPGDKKEVGTFLSSEIGNSVLHRNILYFLGQVGVNSYGRSHKEYWNMNLMFRRKCTDGRAAG
jgi:hypothetical protein